MVNINNKSKISFPFLLKIIRNTLSCSEFLKKDLVVIYKATTSSEKWPPKILGPKAIALVASPFSRHCS